MAQGWLRWCTSASCCFRRSKSNLGSSTPWLPSRSKARTRPSMRHSATLSPPSSTSAMSVAPVGSPSAWAGTSRPRGLQYVPSNAMSASAPPPSFRVSKRCSPPGSVRPKQSAGSAGTVATARRQPSAARRHCVGCAAPQERLCSRVMGPWSFAQTRSLPSAPPTKRRFRCCSPPVVSTVLGTPLPQVQDLGTPRSTTWRCWRSKRMMYVSGEVLMRRWRSHSLWRPVTRLSWSRTTLSHAAPERSQSATKPCSSPLARSEWLGSAETRRCTGPSKWPALPPRQLLSRILETTLPSRQFTTQSGPFSEAHAKVELPPSMQNCLTAPPTLRTTAGTSVWPPRRRWSSL
mmetsp:Transcript_71225/g.230604  ORF Transcript_71225/g.230604 Transcript_71225/m.230604 type:complete len:347 (-) Transcript_71225:287-1327(-)